MFDRSNTPCLLSDFGEYREILKSMIGCTHLGFILNYNILFHIKKHMNFFVYQTQNYMSYKTTMIHASFKKRLHLEF